jgi:hypothetical protein
MTEMRVIHWKHCFVGLFKKTENGWKQLGRKDARKLLRDEGLTPEESEQHIGHLFLSPWFNIPDIGDK